MDWTLFAIIVGPILAALVGAVVGGFVREWWVERFYRPRLHIVGESVIPGAGWAHYRILVKNEGKRAAENSIGIITLDAEEGDVWEPSGYRSINIDEPQPIFRKGYFTKIEGMSLCWSRGQEAIVINRDVTQPLEFCMVLQHSEVPSIRLPCANGWEPYFGVELTANRQYYGRIEVTSANAEPAWASFKLVPDEDDVKLVITERKPSWQEHK